MALPQFAETTLVEIHYEDIALFFAIEDTPPLKYSCIMAAGFGCVTSDYQKGNLNNGPNLLIALFWLIQSNSIFC